MEKPTVARRVLNGMKVAFGFFLALPFLVILVPLWFVYRWREVRSGRPKPEAPWAGVQLPVIFSVSNTTSPSSSIPLSASKPGRKEKEEEPRTPSATQQETRHTAVCVPQQTSSPLPVPLPVPLSGNVALVTGGARYLGAAMCQDLACLGYRVAVVYYRSETQAKTLVAKIQAQGGEAKPFFLDQSDPTQITHLLNAVEKELGIPDLLINNASLFLPTPMVDLTWERLALLCRVNLQGPMWLAMRVGHALRDRASETGHGGQIIQMCDIWGERPLAGYSAYSVTKAGLIMATRALARELAPFVRVNGIAPGAILSKKGATEAANFQKMLAKTPLAQHAGPEAVLQAVRYLLTAPFVTGEILHVDGGRGLL